MQPQKRTVVIITYVHMKFPICPFLCEIYNSYLRLSDKYVNMDSDTYKR